VGGTPLYRGDAKSESMFSAPVFSFLFLCFSYSSASSSATQAPSGVRPLLISAFDCSGNDIGDSKFICGRYENCEQFDRQLSIHTRLPCIHTPLICTSCHSDPGVEYETRLRGTRTRYVEVIHPLDRSRFRGAPIGCSACQERQRECGYSFHRRVVHGKYRTCIDYETIQISKNL
jgi:hypothetical protein